VEAILENKTGQGLTARFRDWLLPALVLAAAVYVLNGYFMPGIQIALAMLLAPFVFRVKTPGSYSYGYAIAAAAFLVLYYFLTVTVLLFLSTGCLLLFSISCRSGRLGILPFLFLVSISPALKYAVSVFTFSIRLELSRYAALMLNRIGMAVENKGAYFIMPDGYSFSVDTACIGLNLFNTGLCVMILLVSFSQLRSKKDLGIFPLGLAFFATAILLVLTNLLRIVAIVLFRSEPGTLGHDLIGMGALVVYTLLPVFFLIRWMIRRFGKTPQESQEGQPPAFRKSLGITLALCLCLIIISGFLKQRDQLQVKDAKLEALVLPGYSKSLKEDGVYEFLKPGVLIYIKPANKAYESDHPPAMCWQASGFRLDEISEQRFGAATILKAVLKRDQATQYTAWWYDNGSEKTVSQWQWRFSKGEPYRIINITTNDSQKLDSLCRRYLAQKLF
jgi:exosortase N